MVDSFDQYYRDLAEGKGKVVVPSGTKEKKEKEKGKETKK